MILPQAFIILVSLVFINAQCFLRFFEQLGVIAGGSTTNLMATDLQLKDGDKILWSRDCNSCHSLISGQSIGIKGGFDESKDQGFWSGQESDCKFHHGSGDGKWYTGKSKHKEEGSPNSVNEFYVCYVDIPCP